MTFTQITKLPSVGTSILLQVCYSRAWAHNSPVLLNGAGTHTIQVNRPEGRREDFDTSHRRKISGTARKKYFLKLKLWDILVFCTRHLFA